MPLVGVLNPPLFWEARLRVESASNRVAKVLEITGLIIE